MNKNHETCDPKTFFIDFCNQTLQKYFFLPLTSILKNDCSQLSFQVYNIYVAQKLKISGFLIELFFAWTLITLLTSRDCNSNLNNSNRASNFSWRFQLSNEILFVGLKWKFGGLDCVSQNGLFPNECGQFIINK